MKSATSDVPDHRSNLVIVTFYIPAIISGNTSLYLFNGRLVKVHYSHTFFIFAEGKREQAFDLVFGQRLFQICYQ